MPAKPRYGKGKHLHQSKKSKAKQRQAAMSTRPFAASAAKSARANEPDNIPLQQPTEVTSKLRMLDYPYITGELKRIGGVAGAIFILLIILAITIP